MGYYHIAGEVTNQGNQKATFVKVSGIFYNSSKAVIAAGFTYTDPKDLEPCQTALFEITVIAPAASETTSATLNVDSQQYSSIHCTCCSISKLKCSIFMLDRYSNHLAYHFASFC